MESGCWTHGGFFITLGGPRVAKGTSMETPSVPFVIPSEPEGSAVQRTSLGNAFRGKRCTRKNEFHLGSGNHVHRLTVSRNARHHHVCTLAKFDLQLPASLQSARVCHCRRPFHRTRYRCQCHHLFPGESIRAPASARR